MSGGDGDRIGGIARLPILLAFGGAAVGLTLSWLHPVGLVVGGGLVSLSTRSLPRGLVAAALFGVVVWLVFVAWLAWVGGLVPAVGTGLPFALSAAVAVGLAGIGGLVRGIVPVGSLRG